MRVDVAAEIGPLVMLLPSDALDAANAPGLGPQVVQGLASRPTLILDMRHVEFADSSGLGALCSLASGAASGRVVMVRVEPKLRATLARVPGRRLPPMFETVDNALHGLVQSISAMTPRPHQLDRSKTDVSMTSNNFHHA